MQEITIEDRVEDLEGRMTIVEKVAQDAMDEARLANQNYHSSMAVFESFSAVTQDAVHTIAHVVNQISTNVNKIEILSGVIITLIVGVAVLVSVKWIVGN